MMRIIPAIDVRDGRCVRLLHGNFDAETHYSDDPVAVARQFSELDVGDLHVVDLDGARTGAPTNTPIVRRIVDATRLDVQVGGGLRSADQLTALFDAGASRCVVGSVAVTDALRVRDWLRQFGPDRIVLALDVRINADGEPCLTTHGWTEASNTTLQNVLDAFREEGLQHVLCTDVERDGALSGPNLPLYRNILGRNPGLGLQASGGVRHADDLHALRLAGVPAAITGKAMLEGRISATEVSSFRQNA